tara:strand:+ start:218 stop:1006 length:789 start_codon:yes stop_codon:yes gene_type:complete
VASLNGVFLTDKYISDKNKYEQGNSLKSVTQFLNILEVNKDYYRTGIKIKNPRYKKNVSVDTTIIKSFKTTLNKISSINYKDLCLKINKEITGKKHLYPLLLQYIFEQSLLQHTYSKYYAELVYVLHSEFNDIELIYKNIDLSYKTITRPIQQNESDYSNLCSKNKQIDQLIGHSIFISELEMKGIIKDKIDISIQSILDQMKTELSEDELYKCILTLYNIFQVVYSDKDILPEYIKCLTDIKDTITFMKIKFKIMDILERR